MLCVLEPSFYDSIPRKHPLNAAAKAQAMNAHFMGCDAFQEGDLLVTFPGCKEPVE